MKKSGLIFISLLVLVIFTAGGFVFAQSSGGLTFERSLYIGLYGEDVKDLQEFLAQDPKIYPDGLVTGFFGPLTEQAVKRFQAKWGIETVGVVGPKTRAKILEISAGIAEKQILEEEKSLKAIEVVPEKQSLSTTTATTTKQKAKDKAENVINLIIHSPAKGEVLGVGYIRFMRWEESVFQSSARLDIDLVNINDPSKNVRLFTRTSNDGEQVWQVIGEPGEYKISIIARCKEVDVCGEGESEIFKIVPTGEAEKENSKTFASLLNSLFKDLFRDWPW